MNRMKVSELIEKLKPYPDFEIRTTVHMKVMEEELQKPEYGFPYDNYDAELSIDDIGYSDKVVLIGVEIPE